MKIPRNKAEMTKFIKSLDLEWARSSKILNRIKRRKEMVRIIELAQSLFLQISMMEDKKEAIGLIKRWITAKLIELKKFERKKE